MSESGACAVPASAPAMDHEQTPLSRREFAWAFVAALVLLVAVNLFILRYDLGGGRSWGIGDVPPALPWFLLLVLLLLSAAARRRLPRLALGRRQLSLIFGFLAIAIPIAGSMGVGSLLPHLSLLSYYAGPENQFARIAAHVPERLTVTDPDVLIPAYEGNADGGVMWRPWRGPVALWSTFMLVLGLGMLCWIALFRDFWNRSERLSYPMLELPRQLLGVSEHGSKAGSFLRDPLMWVGFGAAVLFHAGAIAKHFNPSLPAIPMRTDLAPFLTEAPLRHLLPLRFTLSPITIGAAYLVPQDILFSVWAIYLLYKVVALVGGMAGVATGAAFPFYQEQSTGGYIAYGLLLVWAARSHLASLVRGALRRERDGETYPLNPATALMGTVAGALFVLGWCRANEFALKLAVPYFLLLLLFLTVQARMRADTGVPLGWDYPYGTQKTVLDRVLGTRGIMALGGERGLVMLSFYSWLSRYNYLGYTAAYQTDSLTLWESQSIGRRRAVCFVTLALVVGIALAFAVHLKAAYEWGALFLQGGTLDGSANLRVARAEYQNLSDQLVAGQPADVTRTRYIVLGFLLVPALAALRRSFLRFPLHPLGFLMASCYGPAPYWWFDFLLTWVAKTLILKVGGAGAYRRLVPLFLGMVLGAAMAYDVVWMIVRALLPEGMIRGYV